MSKHRGGSRARVTRKPGPEIPNGLTGYLRTLGGADPMTGKRKPQGSGLANLGENYKQDELAATIVAASHNPLAAGANPEARKILGIEDPTSTKPTRDTAPPKPSPDPGIVQKGTLTGGSRSLTPFDMEGFMTNIATPQGINLRNRFASHQLPGSAEHGTALGMTAGEFETAQSTGGVVQLKNGKYVKTADLNNDNEGGVKTGGLNVDSTAAEVDSFYGVGNNQADNLEEGRTLTPEKINWADRTMADNSDARIRARHAFLNAENSLVGLRRAEGEMGVVAQGGRYATQDAEGNTVELDKAGYQKMMSGQPLAEDFLAGYKDKVIQAATETVEEVTAGAGVAAGVDDQIIESIDGNPIEGGPISVAEFNKRFPNDNK